MMLSATSKNERGGEKTDGIGDSKQQDHSPGLEIRLPKLVGERRAESYVEPSGGSTRRCSR
jgi:hypothetical protein